ncbi:monovalent cation/H(+) antiporter subunit G [Hujiaoplasma nucleasis]|uniref:Monovalent cation/H(+) antiporter subunit G n=1 Tax=Hujiaoplasma nucleasis TaxID=2725268 RepID=A0A7L6N4M5_9MOLU|nr:monovalent cation/H(+) antiporter subunit G [Hujiaoplasma nucleasis]QLY40227.1 monovalent cation/H(+) antiporter subunit G [Hujiaoplasma nucleasis]
MTIVLDIIIILFLIAGLFFFFVGVVGLLRMPNVFTRMHATTKCDTMGAGLVFAALIMWQGFSFISANILLILIFVWITNPTAAHAIAKTAYKRMEAEIDFDEDGE